MTDGQRLLAVFILLYLSECLFWLPHSVRACWSWTGGRAWLLLRPSSNLAASGSGVLMSWPLPPLGGVLITESWPIIPHAAGLWVGESQTSEGRWLAWNQVEPRREQRTLLLNAETPIKCATERRAETLLQQIKALQTQPNGIERWWEDSLSLPRARAELRRYRLASRSLRSWCLLIWMLCFLALPWLYWRYGDDLMRLGLTALMLLAAMLVIAFRWKALDQSLFPQFTSSRFLQTLHLAVMPTHSIRALDLLSVELFAGLQSVVCARLLLPDAEWRICASKEWRKWAYLGKEHALFAASRQIMGPLRTFLQNQGIQADELEAQPPREDGASSYCPRCHAAFVAAEAECRPCGGTHTLPFIAQTASK
jgi:hypothetical protein